MAGHTFDLSESLHRICRDAIEVEIPGIVRFLIRLKASQRGDLIFSNEGLAIKDKERSYAVGKPLVDIYVEASPDASQATESEEEGFVWRGVDLLLEVVRGVDGDRSVFQIFEIVMTGFNVSPLGKASTGEGREGRGPTYATWLETQGSSLLAARSRSATK